MLGRPFPESPAIAYAQRCKAERRRRIKPRFGRKALWAVQKMAIAVVEKEWRVQLIVGADTRDLTGRLLGDPRWERSALYAKTMGFG